MEKEILEFINKNGISAFEPNNLKPNESMFKTKDSKNIFNKTISKISEGFSFPSTKALWKCFPFSDDFPTIKKRQEFFSQKETGDNSFLKKLKKPKKSWRPNYSIIVVTEDEKDFFELQKLNCPVKIIGNEQDLSELDSYDIIQAVSCEDTRLVLETLPQSVFIDNPEDAYLERHLELLSGWKDDLMILKDNKTNEKITKITDMFIPMMELLENKEKERLTKEALEKRLEDINEKIEEDIAKLNISGMQLMSILNKGKLPEQIGEIRLEAIKGSDVPEDLFNDGIPVTLNELEAEKYFKIKDAEEHTSVAERITKNAELVNMIPKKLKELESELVLFDFICGAKKIQGEFPLFSDEFSFTGSKNLFLENSQPISFILDEKNRCSILTGANSGGKTTLLEHIIQLVTLFQLGLPITGKTKMPIFSEVYYFAKNKGEAGKGAFENLLSQMDNIKSGKKTLILADEIESVTEPGVAGKIISATCEYFVERGCFLIIATHLGQEIQKNVPPSSRIDGIEAKGLDEYFELIVDHNPVLGKLASSTPELIIQKLAASKNTEYYNFLNEKVRKKN